MKILALTGSIGMGKSTAAKLLRRLGVPVHDSDRAVHELLGPGGAAVAPIAEAFPGTVQDGRVDRRKLGDQVFGDQAALRRLEAIVHPLVRRETASFLARHRRARRRLVALDVPLLFETGGDRRCDAVLVVTAPHWLQRQRVLRRPGMTERKFAAILEKQVPDREKRRRAQYVVNTGLGLRYTMRQIRLACQDLLRQPPTRGKHARNRPRH